MNLSAQDEQHIYLCIDLKSFFASVECRERGLDPLQTNLVVADASRTEKTICLAVSSPLKEYGIGGRARLFEVVARIREVNQERFQKLSADGFRGASYDAATLAAHPDYRVDYIVAPPQMARYMAYSTQIYNIYLNYIAPEDIHVYSIDEVFIDLTHYLHAAGKNAYAFAKTMILDVFAKTGITATAGIGTNLYLAKIAMDIWAKHIPSDADGVRIAELDEYTYRKQLWSHRPLTDFWRVGRGYAKKLEQNGIYTMGDIARCSVGRADEFYNEELLYRLFGINAELLIDHAWGFEPCRIADIKAYRPETNSISSGQVLHCPYTAEQTRLIVWEMADQLVLDLVEQGLVTDQLVLTIGYDIENLTDPKRRQAYRGPVTTDHYGRKIPKHAHGTTNLPEKTSSTKLITNAVLELYDRIINPSLLVRRLTIAAANVVSELHQEATGVRHDMQTQQLDLFTDYAALEQQEKQRQDELAREKKMQHAVLDIKRKYGKNAILKGTNLTEGATAKDRNRQIGGHKA